VLLDAAKQATLPALPVMPLAALIRPFVKLTKRRSVVLHRLDMEKSKSDRVAVLGTGKMATAMAKFLLRQGTQVFTASHEAHRAAAACSQIGAYGSSDYANIAKEIRILVLAADWRYVPDVLKEIATFDDRVLIDCTNPEGESGLVIGHRTSGSETIAALAPGARIVKAFNHVYAELVDNDGFVEGGRSHVMVAGDEISKEVLRRLVAGSGFDLVDCGSIEVARYLEPLALLMVQLVRKMSLPPAHSGIRYLGETGRKS
jgi:predicted dinucleotide-binding enzyme